METVDAAAARGFWRDRKVLLTGHTGFKGAWLSLWLLEWGARVCGFALPAEPDSLYRELRLHERLLHREGDVRDAPTLEATVREFQPDIVIHMAAQSLVRASYRDPLGTWSTNVLGTAHLLASLQALAGRRCAVVVVTTDKVYENRETDVPYDEDDRLGGHDPYSASKAACELLASSWHRSFLQGSDTALVTARSGNVIGGGDRAADRLFPDLARAFAAGRALSVRNPDSTRPWQHVLDPLNGYLALAQQLYLTRIESGSCWNFGPAPTAALTVRDVLGIATRAWPGAVRFEADAQAPHEAGKLSLSTRKVRERLGWVPRWGIEESIRRTALWYREHHAGRSAQSLCLADIAAFSSNSQDTRESGFP